MKCPKCDFTQVDGNTECPRCGVIFAKLGLKPGPYPATESRASGEPVLEPMDRSPMVHPSPDSRAQAVPPPWPRSSHALGPDSRQRDRQPPRPVTAHEDEYSDREDEELPVSPFGTDELKILAIGGAIAATSLVIPFVRNTFATLMILVHEMGHCLFNWLFGYPSAPAFDFMYGGGLAIALSRSSLLLVVWYTLLAVAIYRFRHNLGAVILLLVLAVVHAALAFTSGHEVLILFMGHGTELLIAGLFLYRAVSGRSIVHRIERPLYAAVGFFIVFKDLVFSYRLISSPTARMEYEQAKGGGHWMDFSRIAEEYLFVDLQAVALFFLLCCVLALPVAALVYRYQYHLASCAERLLSKEQTES